MKEQINPELGELIINVITFIAGWLTRLIQKSKFRNNGKTQSNSR